MKQIARKTFGSEFATWTTHYYEDCKDLPYWVSDITVLADDEVHRLEIHTHQKNLMCGDGKPLETYELWVRPTVNVINPMSICEVENEETATCVLGKQVGMSADDIISIVDWYIQAQE